LVLLLFLDCNQVLQTAKHIYIVLELITGGELFDRIVAAKRFDEATGRKYFQQLILGMYYCHQQVHLDGHVGIHSSGNCSS
jgi:serine/threonine protein kinase